jgi:hypothetical protein
MCSPVDTRNHASRRSVRLRALQAWTAPLRAGRRSSAGLGRRWHAPCMGRGTGGNRYSFQGRHHAHPPAAPHTPPPHPGRPGPGALLLPRGFLPPAGARVLGPPGAPDPADSSVLLRLLEDDARARLGGWSHALDRGTGPPRVGSDGLRMGAGVRPAGDPTVRPGTRSLDLADATRALLPLSPREPAHPSRVHGPG